VPDTLDPAPNRKSVRCKHILITFQGSRKFGLIECVCSMVVGRDEVILIEFQGKSD